MWSFISRVTGNLFPFADLFVGVDHDGFSLGVVESVLSVDGREHAQTKEEDRDEDGHGNQSRPDGNCEETDAVVHLTKLPSVLAVIELGL